MGSRSTSWSTCKARRSKMMNIEATLERTVAAVREEYGNRLLSAVLFGSQARGGSDRLSDIDLLVVVTGLPLEWRERKNTFALSSPGSMWMGG